MSDDGLTPTRGQTLALDLSRNLAVTAGAGTGKTWVLTRRFLDLLERAPAHEEPHAETMAERGFGPEHILAVTFTRKAAQEMRTRITEGIGKKIAAAREAGDAVAYRTWTHHRRRLAEATITTIHGLAAEIVRAYGLEEGIDPDHGMLEGAAQDELRHQAVHDALVTSRGDTYRTLAETLAFRHHKSLEELVIHLLKNRAFARRWLDTLERYDDETILMRLTETLVPFTPDETDDLLRALNGAGRRYIDLPGIPDHPTAQAFRARLQACQDATHATFPDQARAIHALWDHITTDKGAYYTRPNSAVGPKGPWESGPGTEIPHATLDALVETFRQNLGDDPFPPVPGPLDAALLAENRALAEVYRKAYAHYAHAKDIRSVLDFDDLQHVARDLLAKGWVREALQRRFRYLLVDEFQDTDPVQWALVQALACDDTLTAVSRGVPVEEARWHTAEDLESGPVAVVHEIDDHEDDAPLLGRDRLFLVGDEKQSIYAFRGADVTVYKGSRSAVVEANRTHGADRAEPLLPTRRPQDAAPPDHTEILGEVALDTNFRSLPTLVSFVNACFAHVLAPESSDGHAEHEAAPGALAAHRREDAVTGTIRFLLSPADPQKIAEREGVPDAVPRMTKDDLGWTRLARCIVDDVEGDSPLQVEDQGRARPAGYDDIAILLARRKPVPDIVRALRAHGIPHAVAGGRGFWDTQEVWDLYGLLAVLADPRRDLELAGLLRSPFFAWTDGALVRLHGADGRALFDKLACGAEAELDLGTPLPLDETRALLDAWHARAGHEPTSTLLAEILDTTHYVASLGPDDRARQAVRNVDKFLDTVRDLEVRQGIHPARLVRELERILDSDLDEGEATVPVESGHGVRILTVHASKGLEFPIVHIPELDRGFQYGHLPRGYQGDTVRGTDLTLLAASMPGADGEKATPSTYRALSDQAREKGRAETKRLLYVALTRAKDHLVLHGAAKRYADDVKPKDARPPTIREGSSWLDWFEHLLGVEAGTYVDGPKKTTTSLGDVPVTLDLTLPDPDRPVRAHTQNESQPGPPPYTPPALAVAPPLVTITPSALETHAACPRRFYHRHVESVPEARPKSARRRDEEHATLIGDLVHQSLENGATKDVPVPHTVERRAYRRARAIGRDPTKVVEDVRRHVQGALEALDEGDAAMHEVGLDRHITSGIRIRGRIDRLARSPTGWRITDYKTDHVTGETQTHAAAHGHTLQASAYAGMVHDASADDTEAALLFTGPSETVAITDDQDYRSIVEKLRSPGTEEDWPPNPSKGLCGGCGYWEGRGGRCPGLRQD